ncbi:6-bladed beta-propeller [Fusibacter ferrireducens]|uniref:6-bladed beta-propeller n=1 Tax=Fusibacter ferrireducens TaxID=2785058 RepID=A0ABR9ZS11_9FIRM|nr:6-bladed beta-propeller [Fusibacter ferrireducens]MBF4692419.1 6-bladed beta-propeller [Fusibacter ferrireducens]
MSRKLLKSVSVLGLILLLLSQITMANVADVLGEVTEGATEVYFNSPVAMAKDSSGNIYVADMSNHRIVKMNSNGTVLQKFGTLGSAPGQFDTPFGVSIDNNGNILVADTANYRIQKFDANWNYITSWGSFGNGNGQFGLPREIGIDSQNRYHVCDEFHDRIQVFDENGAFLYQYGTRGTAQGQFRLPQGIAIKQSTAGDRVYICDTFNNRVQVLDVNGNFIEQIGTGTAGDSDYQFLYPRGVNLDDNGDVYIADTFNHKIKKYDANHQYQYSTTIGLVKLEPIFPCQVLPLGDGKFIVSDTGNSQLLKFSGYSTYATLVDNFGKLRSNDGVFSGATGVAVDDEGYAYVTDTANHRVQKFDSSGNLVDKWGGNGGDGGPMSYGIYYWQFTVPKQICYDKYYDNLVIADTGNSRIQVFSKNGTWLSNFGYGHLTLPVGVCTTSDGCTYVADTGGNRIVKFSPLGIYADSWGTEGMQDGQFRQPFFIASDSQDNIYVTDRANSRIQKFDKHGNFITKWGTNGGVPNVDPLDNWGFGDGDLFLPIGITIDDNDYVYVTDSSNNRVQKFTSDGVFVEKWGIFSGSSGNFFSPQGIACGANGEVYVADGLLNRVIKFIK